MNGLLSATPSPRAIRLALGGYLLLLVLAALVLLAPPRGGPRGAAGLIGVIACACPVIAVAGVPEAPDNRWRGRHGR